MTRPIELLRLALRLEKRMGLGLFGLLALHGAAQADYVGNLFSLPGYSATSVWDINDAGALVGEAVIGNVGYGYLYSGGSVTRLDGPVGSTGASAIGISNDGAVVGQWSDALENTHPYVYRSGAYVLTDLAIDGITATARSISPDGRYLTGYYGLRGFVYDLTASSVVTTFGVAGKQIIAQGINSAGQIVGDMRAGVQSTGFLYDINTNFRTDFAFAGANRTAPRAINDRGQIAGWLLRPGGVEQAWIGNTTGYQVIAAGDPALGTVGEGLNNLGQVVGFKVDNTASSSQNPGFIATPVVLPIPPAGGGGPADLQVYTFSTAVVADVPVFIDPPVAVGYAYAIGAGDPLFKSVSLPTGVGDNLFDIEVGAQHFAVHGNEIFDFTAHGYAAGVAQFKVNGIEPWALLDPSDSQAFVTRLTFASSGHFTGTQTVLIQDYSPNAVPEPRTAILILAGLAGVATWRRRILA